ncbi:hypothetical protein SAMN05421869_122133 [Nonomuraea jiangxiensis]|uniref:Uncharacterized protein n=1 Tax=Nonomuraea jiangxiensis TaxID=633440 RepID=A0A1G9HJS1_9ACTN|nr:hypothetical protein SAMN05421869_122133 [Nonomuraea jiangxiensis]
MCLDHSPLSTRVYRSLLLGLEGVVASLLRNGQLALLKLDDSYYLPEGTRRWAVSWDDLYVGEPAWIPDDPPAPTYVAGLSTDRRNALQHAVLFGASRAVCSSPVRPLPFCGWSMPFAPNVPHACPKCVTLINGS